MMYSIAQLRVVLILGLAAPPLPLPTPIPASGPYAELRKVYDGAMKKYQEERDQAKLDVQKELLDQTKAAENALLIAKSDQETTAARKQLEALAEVAAIKIRRRAMNPTEEFSARFLEFAEKNPQDGSAFDSVMLALQLSGGVIGKVVDPAIKNLQTYHLANPGIKKAFRLLESAPFGEAIESFARDVMARNPSRKIQALACRELARWLASTVRWSEDLKQNPAERSNAERIWGKDHIAWIIANTDRAKKDAEALALVLQESYGDIFPDLAIGKRAPEIGSHDIDGKSVKLSAFKGRVVVLDFWATWCGPCRAMIPHQREMVERLKDKPFALVSISIDEEKETLTKLLAKEKMPWIHWWPGTNEGGVVEDWNIYRVPTIYVIDAQGVIRHKDIRGEELEAAVHKLLEELEQKSSD